MQPITQRILVNSLPKSGTHLLTRSVELFGFKEYFTQRSLSAKMAEMIGLGIPKLLNYRQAKLSRKRHIKDTRQPIPIGALSPYFINRATAQYWFSKYPYHHYIHGHVPYSLELAEILTALDYRHLLIMRDPRAVIVSQLAHILQTQDKTGMGMHFLHEDFSVLNTQQQLEFMFKGGYAKQAGLVVQDFRKVYDTMLAWRKLPGCLLVKYEELVGEQGGGDADTQRATVAKIAEHLRQAMPEYSQIAQIYSPQSRTFRSGKISTWQDALTALQIEQINEYCAPLREVAGYED